MKKLLFVMTVTLLFAGILFAQNPPTNLAYTLNDHDVTLTWDAPQNGGSGEETILRYDNGENSDGIGTGQAADFDVAIKFDPDALAPYSGQYLTQIDFFPKEANCSYSVRVWQGADAANLLVDQAVDNPTIEEWNYITLDTPVQIDASQELWIGYNVNTQTGYPAGCDAGPAVAGYGDMIYFQGAWQSISQAYNLDYNWNIAGHVVDMVKGATIAKVIGHFPKTNSVAKDVATLKLGHIPPANHNSRILNGYNVYRNDTLIGTVNDSTTTTYLDAGLEDGVYTYYVTAVYDTGESEPSNTVTVTVTSGNPDLDPPTNLNVTVQADDAILSWVAPGGGGGEEFFEDFDGGGIPEGWTIVDADGDGYNWENTIDDGFGFDAHSGEGAMTSASYVNGVGALTPDNWLITPPIEIGATSVLSYWHDAQDPNWADEYYYVKVSTTGNDIADFTDTIWEGTTPADWAQITLDLSAYAGQTIYIAWEHTNVTDMFYMKIDDVQVTSTTTRAAAHRPIIAKKHEGYPFRTTGMSYTQIQDKLNEYNANNHTRDLLGYNIYRDGVMIANTTETTYTDADLDAGTYTYYVTAVYDEGESLPTDTVVATILGTGTIYGVVTDAATGNTVEGATVTAGDNETTTAADGTYSMDVTEGTYTVTCTATGYANATVEDVEVTDGATVEVNFNLLDSANPPTNVQAQANDEDTEVTVTWSEPGGGSGEEQWIHYDNGENSDGIGTGGAADFDVAIRFTPEQLADFGNMYVTKVRFFPKEASCEYSIKVWQGENAANLLVEQPVANPTIDDWNEVELDNPVLIDNSQELWIGYRCNAQTGYPAGVDAGPAEDGYGDMIYFQGAWITLIDANPDLNFNWNIQGWVSNSARGDVASTPLTQNVSRKYNGTLALGHLPISPNAEVPRNRVRSLEGYNVYRLLEGDEDNPSNWTTLTEGTTDMMYVDTDWANVSSGIYKYAVIAVYTNNNLSNPAFSNVVYKDMTTTATVNITTNSGDSAEGAEVLLTNIDQNPDHSYMGVADANGTVMFDNVWKGEYMIDVTLGGFEEYTQSNIEILEPTTIDVELTEMLLPPGGLEGTIDGTTATFTWLAPGSFQSWTEDFEGGTIPEGWTTYTNSAVGWFVTMDGSSDYFQIPPGDGYYACSNDDAADDDGSMDYLITPPQDFSALTSMTMTFDSFFNGSYSQTASVEVSEDGGSTWTDIYDLTGQDSWVTETVDLSAYCGAGHDNVLVAFHSNDNGAWASGWAVDNVTMGADTNNRALLGYNLYMDGTAVNGDTPITETTYTQTDIPAGNHVWVVTAVYTTGESVPSNVFQGTVGTSPNQLPAVTKLNGNYPNPFNPETNISYSVSKPAKVTLTIYNLKGQKVRTLVNDYQQAKNYSVVWNGKDDNGRTVANGVYLYKLKVGKYTATKKMIMMK